MINRITYCHGCKKIAREGEEEEEVTTEEHGVLGERGRKGGCCW